MGTPNSAGLSMLVRKKQITDEEWLLLIEARRDLIKPHLDSFTLPELGSLKCLRAESFTHEIKIDNPVVGGDSRFSLKTQGIFYQQPWPAVEYSPDFTTTTAGGRCWSSRSGGLLRIWGLRRTGLWVVAEISFSNEPGYKNRGYQKAQTVAINEVNTKEMVAITKATPYDIWRKLGESIKEWLEFRNRLYLEALSLARMVEIEELSLSLISEE